MGPGCAGTTKEQIPFVSKNPEKEQPFPNSLGTAKVLHWPQGLPGDVTVPSERWLVPVAAVAQDILLLLPALS